ncbi:MAG: sulfatase-like hydrolase/transferase [Stappiaceae bacterium]
MDRPNVLVIMTDQQRPDTLGYLGKTPCRTPNIDAIAKSGVSFDNAITPCPLCLPSRAAFFTGQYPTQNNMMSNQSGQLTSCAMLDRFRQAGYEINYAGKWHMGEGNIEQFCDRHAGDSTAEYSRWCLNQGLIDGWMFNDPATRTGRTPSMSIPKVHRQDLPVEKTNEAYITDFAIDMIQSRSTDKPFFQVVSYNGPHPPFMIPEPYFSMYDPQEVPVPKNFGPNPGEHSAHTSSFYRTLFEDHGTEFDAWRSSYAVYWGFVSMIDMFVGQLLSVLSDENLQKDTIIVFTSDHGENLGAHGLWQKMVPFEESIRVPLIISIPKCMSRSSQTPASLIDVLPTLATLCGVPSQPEWAGNDLMTRQDDQPGRPAQFAMHQPIGDWMNVRDWRMVRADGYKYIWHRGAAEELFDLNTDPDELDNLASSESSTAVLKKLRSEINDFLIRTSDPLLTDWQQDFSRFEAKALRHE